jgi:hypothetical protein
MEIKIKIREMKDILSSRNLLIDFKDGKKEKKEKKKK